MENTVSMILLIISTILFTLVTIRLIAYIREKFKKPDPPYKFLDELMGRKIEFRDSNFGTCQGTIESIHRAKGKGKDKSKNYDFLVKVGRNNIYCNIYAKWRFI